MSGHSKWSTIKRAKAKEDAKRSKVFTRLIRELTVAARMGGGDANANPRLRDAISKAQSANMPKDTMMRAVSRGAGGDDGANLEEITYEGYGTAGVAVLVECMTDNKNRTVAEVRHAFSKHGGNMGTTGSVGFMFEKKGVISFEPGANEDVILEKALEAGADDVVTNDDGSVDVITAPDMFTSVKEAMDAAKLTYAHADISMEAVTKVTLDLDAAEKNLALLDRLEELDDVQAVYSNVDIPEDVMEKLV